ncbi:hypothetical protein B0H14DRAFT_1114629 [Mycena olivaceomarginata]|nr:hypothetical protein B0H14DRAFT_1114629 [Mycena olivaceomarginata]
MAGRHLPEQPPLAQNQAGSNRRTGLPIRTPDSWAPDSQDVTTEWGVRDPVLQPQRPNSYRRVDTTTRSGWMQEIDDKEWVMDQQAEQGPGSSELAFGYSSQERAPCAFFLKNRCFHGDSCRFSHNVSDSDIKPTLSPCIYFRRGSCRDGDSCPFFHGALDPSSSFSGGGDHPKPAATGWETEHSEHSGAGWLHHTDESPEWNEWNATQSADEWITNVEADGSGNTARSSPVLESLLRPPNPLSDTILSPEPEPEPQSLYRCTVRFGSGAIPEEVATEFDAFRLTLSNYPLGIAHEDLVQLAAPWGVVKNTTFSVTHGGMRAHIEFEECSQAAEARVNLNGITLDELVIHAQLDSISSVSGNIHEPETGCQLKLVWEAPSVSAWVFYPTVGVAKDESARLNGILYGERQITAEYVKPSQVHSIPVLLRGLPNGVKKEELHTFCTRSSSVSLNSPNYRESQNDNIRSYLTQFGPVKILEVLPTKASDLEITGFVEFATRKAAADALQALKKTQHEFLGKGRISAQSVVYSKYDCSNCPFTLIRDELQHLSGPSSDATCTIQCYDKPPRVYVYGRRANAVAHVRKSVQDLIFGTEFATWDPYFDTSSSDEALRRISDDTSFHIERDKRRRALRIWGRRELAEKKIIRLLKTVQGKRHSLRLAQGSLPALIRGGLQKLHDEFGTSKVLLDVHSRTVTVLGDIKTEVEARLQTLPVRNSSGTQTNDCRLCFADAIEPVELACSHIYCSGCLKLVLRPVAGLEFVTPRACVADVEGGSCLVPIPIRTIFSHLSDIDQTTLFEGSLAFICPIRTHIPILSLWVSCRLSLGHCGHNLHLPRVQFGSVCFMCGPYARGLDMCRVPNSARQRLNRRE